MPKITLKFNENVVGEYNLGKDSSLDIGRRNTNNIVIENLAVSGHHAKIDSVGNGYLFTDLKSKNGSFVNEQLVLSHYLSHGDVINIGKHSLAFEYIEGEERPETGDIDKTMVMDTEKHRAMMTGMTSGQEDYAEDDGMLGVLSFISGGGEDIILNKKITKIGKDPSFDIVVSGFLLGKYAAMISKRDAGYYISHVEGIIKPKVNNVPVKGEPVKLEEFDTIQIGSVRMKFVHKK